MSDFEVPTPILNSPFAEPASHWLIEEGRTPVKMRGRRTAGYCYRDPRARGEEGDFGARGEWQELALVNLIRQRMVEWRASSRPGVTRTTRELLDYWSRDGRETKLFFAQVEAAETVIFLTEARADFLQGIDVPLDEPSDDRKADGFKVFRRLGCKMATGSGKTTVMAMLSAWSILNKINDRSDARYSDVVLVVCPNVTIRNRLQEIDPKLGESSIYRTRDLVPERLMADLTQGRVLITNWHVFEPQGLQIGGVSAKVAKAGVPVRIRETITIAAKTTSMRGSRYLTQAELDRQIAAGLLAVIGEQRDAQGNLRKVEIEAVRYVESDTALVNRILGREVGGKQNILILNDEAHHAYRIRNAESEDDDEEEEEDADYLAKEATVWVDGLDRINKLRGINFCVDLSATPYFIGRVGQETNRVFPWVVSEFGLTDAIESGLVKIPQLAVRDTSGAEIPGYFNIWRWILPKLTPAERGAKKGSPKPEAILKYANTPISMLAGLWDELRREWAASAGEPRPPVFIVVCKNTRIAKVIHEWLAEGEAPTGIPTSKIEALKNIKDRVATIRVDTKVVQESDTDQAKSNEVAWMRLTLDTVGKLEWTRDRQGRPIHPEGFEELAKKLERPLHPPGRDVRCIVSVGMLTEGWDCNTVTHIIGLRPFMSQAIRNRITVDWSAIPTLTLDPKRIPPEVDVKGALPSNTGRPSLHGPGLSETVTLEPYRHGRRMQELAFQMARDLTRDYVALPSCEVPAHVLFPQILRIVQRYVAEKVIPEAPAELIDVFMSPYYGWVIERLIGAIHPDASQGEAPEVPVYEKNRVEGSTGEVDFWTSREVREVVKSHLNYVVADTKQWEQSAAYAIDKHPVVDAFVKNAGLGFAIPYFHNGQPHDYEPDFIIRLAGENGRYLILETKGYDELAEVKAQAAKRWAEAVNADGRHGMWQFTMIRKVGDVAAAISAAAAG
jgi:hypothetical protein